MRRPLILTSIALGAVAFLVISALLARALSVGGAEDAAITALVRAEARGDSAQLISLIDGCASSSACRERAAQLAATLRHPGAISIAQIQESAGFSLTSTVGTARVAWMAGGSLPRTQCVRVRHAGNVLSGFRIQLLEVSRRIVTDADCPARF
ncbi:MAG TPA: hypothetical protein VKV27_02755 [Solirubrobacteraceae bacterium]|nr:hypothetical protein [Solirubrobacteraceae bacterium]